MKYIKKEEALEKLQKLIDARKNRNCNRQALVEAQAFEYAKVIINSCEEIDED